MDEARAVLERLERIEALDRAGAGRGALLPELRALLEEAEAWSSTEGGDAGADAVEDYGQRWHGRLRGAVSHDMIAV